MRGYGRDASPSTSRADTASPVGRRHAEDRDELPARRVRPRSATVLANRLETLEVQYRGRTCSTYRSQAAQFFAPISRIARHLQHACRGGPGLRAPRAECGPCPAAKLSASKKLASELRGARRERTVYVLGEPHDRPALRTSASSSSCCSPSRQRAALSSSSSTTWTSSIAPTGSSTWGPGAARAAPGMVVAEGTEQVATVEESFTGQYLAEVLTEGGRATPLSRRNR